MRNILYLFITVSIMFLYSGCKAPSPDGPAQTNLNGIQSDLSGYPPVETSGGYVFASSSGIQSLSPTPADLGVTADITAFSFGSTSYVFDASSEPHLNPEPSTIIMFGMSVLGMLGYGIINIRNRNR